MKKPYTMTAVFLLSLIAVLQLLRFILDWRITVEGITVPVWASGIAFLVAGALAILVWRETRSR